MSALRRGIGLTLAFFMLTPALGQSLVSPPEGEPAFQPYAATPSRVLAGVRGYSKQVVEALARLAEHPALLEGAASAAATGGQPLPDDADLPPQVRAALELVGRSPELLALAAMHPDELRALRSLWSVAPDGVNRRLDQLRRGYGQAAREAAWAWQHALENDPVALGEYRDLLARFCAAQRQVVADFACVRVTDRRYYYACPPDEAVIAYASEVGVPRALSAVLERWWSEHAPQEVDAKLEQAHAFEPTTVGGSGFVYDWTPERRAAMWQPAEAGDSATELGLMPVILQPPADQPPAARLASAVAEHARLWSPPVPAIALSDPDVASVPEPDSGWSDVVIEEAIPGPQTARYEDGYLDTSDWDRQEYVAPQQTVVYYGGATSVPYYRGPTYCVYPRGSVFYPDDVYYSCGTRSGGRVYLHGGYYSHGRWVPSYRSHDRIHYGGGRHYGHVSVSAGGSSYGSCRLHSGGSSRGHTTHAYRPHSPRTVSRRGGAVSRTSTGRVGRSHSGVTVRSGSRPTYGSRQTIRSGSRSPISFGQRSPGRSGLRPGAHSGQGSRLREVVRNKVQKIRSNHPTRSGGHAVRPSSRSGHHNSGVRRR